MPKVSFVIPSYNHGQYIATTVQSVLSQTVDDFELIIIDDCSTDDSRDVIKSFDDPRIKLIENETNIGGNLSVNRALAMASGEFIVNLDSDDWFEPTKTEKQLRALEGSPKGDIAATWVRIEVDPGADRTMADLFESAGNRPIELNQPEAWCVRNPICRSSTMLRRTVHERLGYYDITMNSAPDYDLWVRALNAGFKYVVVEELLTHYRLHNRGVTHANPLRTMLEIAYLMVTSMYPLLRSRATWSTYTTILNWHLEHPLFASMPTKTRYRLLAFLVEAVPVKSCDEFKAYLYADVAYPREEAIGRNLLIMVRLSPAEERHRDVLVALEETTKAKQWWQTQAERWEAVYHSHMSAPASREREPLFVGLRRYLRRRLG